MAETLASGLRKRLWILIVGAVFGIVAGWATANASSLDEVTSSAQILITGELSEGKVDTALASTQYVGQRMPTYAGLATSEIVKGEVAKRLNVDVSTLSPADIIVGNPTGTTLLDIAVKSKKPADAKARAEAIVDVLSAQIKGIEMSVVTTSTWPLRSASAHFEYTSNSTMLAGSTNFSMFLAGVEPLTEHTRALAAFSDSGPVMVVLSFLTIRS